MEEIGDAEESGHTDGRHRRAAPAGATDGRRAGHTAYRSRRVTSASMSDRSRKIVKPAAAVGVLATMASIWWFALRPRRKDRLGR